MVEQTFLVDHVLQDILGRLEAIPGPVEHLCGDGLLLLVVEAVEEGVGWIEDRGT